MKMENMLTYVEESRELGFEQKPFNIVDGLVLSQISYLDYSKSPFVREEFNLPLCVFFQNATEKILCPTIMEEGDRQMMELLKKEGRHGSIRACRFVNVLDEKKEKQFSAITFELGNDEYYIAFRGTDNTVTGWKEDFAMCYKDQVPAQKAALKYAMEILGEFPGNVYIGGHSKGGNLAVYAAMHLPEMYQYRILEVHNFDGPGFASEVYQSEQYKRICSITRKFVPQSSIIGMMLDEGEYVVVRSRDSGMMQHNPYNWVICGDDFVYEQLLDEHADFTNEVLDKWIGRLSMEEREKIVDVMFDVISKTGMSAFKEWGEETLVKTKKLLEGFTALTLTEKKTLFVALTKLIRISAEEATSIAKEWRDN